MGVKEMISVVGQLPALLNLKRNMKRQPDDTRDSWGARVEDNARKFPDRVAFVFEGQTVTWADFNAHANRFAAGFSQLGLERGDTVSLMMENRIEFLALVVAMSKLGISPALLNTNLHGDSLKHCMRVTDSKLCVFGEEVADAVSGVTDDMSGLPFAFVSDKGDTPAPDWCDDFGTLCHNLPTDNPASTADTTLGETAAYLFTSGTTGLPKAARVSNHRLVGTGLLAHHAGLRCTEEDRLYICLPLYHGTGLMVGIGAAISSGASVFIRRKFSASRFLSDVREHNTTCLIYIGELCRYLVNSPAGERDADNPLRSAMGNGLRPDVWPEFKERYGLTRITEFYGASEGNVAFANLLNKDCTIGMTSSEIAVVRYDTLQDEIDRDDSGFCIPVDTGEAGLLLGRITEAAVFEGYTDEGATEKKILRDVLQPGDAYFNTGDLIREIDVGFALGYPHYQFVDRVGDTFRWKSENVSTNEVGEILNAHPQIEFSNVYGVEIPGADGRAGMAALVLRDDVDDLDVDGFSQYVHENLPAYARPVFLRVRQDIEVTGTFKMLKGKLREEAYDFKKISEPVLVLKPGSQRYEPLDEDFLADVEAARAGF